MFDFRSTPPKRSELFEAFLFGNSCKILWRDPFRPEERPFERVGNVIGLRREGTTGLWFTMTIRDGFNRDEFQVPIVAVLG